MLYLPGTVVLTFCLSGTCLMEANMMNYWTKPVFDEFDVSAECTAYAGAAS